MPYLLQVIRVEVNALLELYYVSAILCYVDDYEKVNELNQDTYEVRREGGRDKIKQHNLFVNSYLSAFHKDTNGTASTSYSLSQSHLFSPRYSQQDRHQGKVRQIRG